MDTKRIVYTRPDGGVSVVIPAHSVEQARNSVPVDATDVVECETADIPADRTFRDAWMRDTGAGRMAIAVDMAKARAIHMDRIREARRGTLAALDIAQMRAVGAGDVAAVRVVETQKQALRELPQTFDLTGAATPEQLQTLWPPALAYGDR